MLVELDPSLWVMKFGLILQFVVLVIVFLHWYGQNMCQDALANLSFVVLSHNTTISF